jgi:hypothetical protein
MESVRRDESSAPIEERRRAVRIFARSLFRELTVRRYEWSLLVAFATELIELVNQHLASQQGRLAARRSAD